MEVCQIANNITQHNILFILYITIIIHICYKLVCNYNA